MEEETQVVEAPVEAKLPEADLAQGPIDIAEVVTEASERAPAEEVAEVEA